MSSPSTSVFPCQYHSTIAPHSSIHLPHKLFNDFLPVLQFSPLNIIPFPLFADLLHVATLRPAIYLRCTQPLFDVFISQLDVALSVPAPTHTVTTTVYLKTDGLNKDTNESISARCHLFSCYRLTISKTEFFFFYISHLCTELRIRLAGHVT